MDVAQTGREASQMLLTESYRTIVLDVMLPDSSGFDLCRRLREAGNFVPVLMLTARSSLDDRVTGLNAGADDYLAKPFDLQELVARVGSLVRRQGWENHRRPEEPPQRYRFGNVEVDFDTHQVKVGEDDVPLTHLEMELLRYFVLNANRVLSREELLEAVWNLRDVSTTRTVDNFLMRLRRALEPDPAKPKYFVSVRGRGYCFRPTGRREAPDRNTHERS